MLQCELGNAKVTPFGCLPQTGFRLREFCLPALDDSQVSLSDFRGRSNLVLCFPGAPNSGMRLLDHLVLHSSELQTRDASFLIILGASPDDAREFGHNLPSGATVLCDQDGSVHKAVGADPNHAAVYVTDRFAEIVALWRTAEGQELPDGPEVLRWLDFIESQCPECDPAEWPIE